ncbi:hypothetical protein FA13DRAFT_1738887 [Coprinellus micaceus]|uniref:BTB domain-containing protein n=1 Tax=Coprinellus micaceus TaxID=71717 RepID=A0A4Y7SSP5_COPMI|nr:hypothetical protein FA13DRAFT_1738887 [Coprinellus micaceus]
MTSGRDFRWDITVFKVEDRIFRHSEVFEGMYLLPSTGEGTTDNNPIVLRGYKAADFEALLMILYPSFHLTKEQWIGILRVARPWEMHKIREFAIKTLSTKPFDLAPVEKVTLARDHRVASWLVEGLTSLTLRETELSPDQLEEAVGLQTAFRIVSIQVAGLTKATGLSTSAIRCGGCYKPCLEDQFACHSCSKVLSSEGTVAMYIATSSVSGNNIYNCDSGVQFGFPSQYLYCNSCSRRAITRYTNCKLCSTCVCNGSANFQIYASFGQVPQDTRPSTEIVVRTTFKDEIQEYDL